MPGTPHLAERLRGLPTWQKGCIIVPGTSHLAEELYNSAGDAPPSRRAAGRPTWQKGCIIVPRTPHLAEGLWGHPTWQKGCGDTPPGRRAAGRRCAVAPAVSGRRPSAPAAPPGDRRGAGAGRRAPDGRVTACSLASADTALKRRRRHTYDYGRGPGSRTATHTDTRPPSARNGQRWLVLAAAFCC